MVGHPPDLATTRDLTNCRIYFIVTTLPPYVKSGGKVVRGALLI